MKFYRLHQIADDGSSAGYEFFTDKRLAEVALRAMRKQIGGDPVPSIPNEIDIIEINPTKKGILTALNQYASHADNG